MPNSVDIPAVGDIVVADILNYHRHGIPLPKAGQDIALDLRWDVPENEAGRSAVLQIGISTPRLHDKSHMKDLSLCLVIDCSQSMGEAGKMNRVQQALLRFLKGLRPTDQVAIVTYSSEARVLLSSRRLGNGAAHRRTIRSLTPDGYTNLHAGLMLGYRQVRKHGETDTIRRVILLTDGIANRGVIDAATIAKDSKAHNAKGIGLSTIGVGMNFNRDLLATLAKSGRGVFHFVADDKARAQ